MGLTDDQQRRVWDLADDLATFHGADPDDAARALHDAVTGDGQRLVSWHLNLSDATVSVRMVMDGSSRTDAVLAEAWDQLRTLTAPFPTEGR